MSPYSESAILLLCFAIFWFIIALLKKDNSIADIAWGLGFILIAWWVNFRYGNSTMLSVMVTVWGARLALYIGLRNIASGEDWRYQKWRKEWRSWFFVRSFLQVFVLQAAFLWVIALPLMQTGGNELCMSAMEVIGAILWSVGFVYEAVADWQLMNFKKAPENKGKIMTKGLWKLSRHPNYFGEILVWWGVFFFVFDLSDFTNWQNLILVFSPLTITWLLNNVSGVPMLESKYKNNPSYRAYVKETNALIPDLRKVK